uniref:AlNc14C360G10989 protein n=1 Tax=Albugo laibachii Nc14 TaxID=890382 RepID=F0WXQ3_9STRA|nr:AlNc14C360G10989 [Albugo laibachii Nc14]|eukprot:CCA26249.1 AlNc14C360G10989 [Albugo laibachii Nc14]
MWLALVLNWESSITQTCQIFTPMSRRFCMTHGSLNKCFGRNTFFSFLGAVQVSSMTLLNPILTVIGIVHHLLQNHADTAVRKIIMKSASSESNLLLMSKLAQFDVLHGACRHQKHGHEIDLPFAQRLASFWSNCSDFVVHWWSLIRKVNEIKFIFDPIRFGGPFSIQILHILTVGLLHARAY